jgi:myo-inositol 2-dehydrogenase/D-chiro-inositol 1-dehydrogenase
MGEAMKPVRPPVRFGIVSFAQYHGNFWAQAVASSPDARLVGVWDDRSDRGQERAAHFGTRYHEDLAALLRECDAVGITSETAHHADLVEAAASAGVHVLCEKPMAASLHDCDRIERAVRASGITYMQSFPKRLDPVNHELVDMVHRGELGRVNLVRIRHANHHMLDGDLEPWFTDPALSGGGALLDEGIHAFDFLLWLLGDPVSVWATTSSYACGLPVEDTAVVVLAFSSGTLGEVVTGGALLAALGSIEVYGTAGVAVLSGVDLASRDSAAPPYLRVHRRGHPPGSWEPSPTVPRFRSGDFHQQNPLRFIDCLLSGQAPPTGLREGRRAVEVALAAYRSAETGIREPIALTA